MSAAFLFLIGLVWLLWMNPVNAGAPVRFLFPAMLVALVLNKRNKSFAIWMIALSLAGLILVQKTGWTPYILFGLPALYYSLILAGVNFRAVVVAAGLVFLPLRIFSSGFSVTATGYDYYFPGHQRLLRTLSAHPGCLTTVDWAVPEALAREKMTVRLYTFEGMRAAREPDSAAIRFLLFGPGIIHEFPALASRFKEAGKIEGLILYKRAETEKSASAPPFQP